MMPVMTQIPKEAGDTLSPQAAARERSSREPLPELSVLREMSEPSLAPPSDALGTWAHLLPILGHCVSEGHGTRV